MSENNSEFAKIIAKAWRDPAFKAELAANPGGEFTGPIVDTAGKEQLADGVTHTYEELMGMQYLVEGVDGEIPAG